jgi:hypothetical protein
MSKCSKTEVDNPDAALFGEEYPIDLSSIAAELDSFPLLCTQCFKQLTRLGDVATNASTFHSTNDTNGTILVVVVGTVDTGQKHSENDVVLFSALFGDHHSSHGENVTAVSSDFFALSGCHVDALATIHACVQVYHGCRVLEGSLRSLSVFCPGKKKEVKKNKGWHLQNRRPFEQGQVVLYQLLASLEARK